MKRKKETLLLPFTSNLWSRRGSNPRPNDEFSSFLHAYFSIGFRSTDGQEHPNR